MRNTATGNEIIKELVVLILVKGVNVNVTRPNETTQSNINNCIT